MNQEKVGAFIADLRKSQGMSQKQLADIVGVTDKSVSKWECGKSLPEISKMEPLCEALHININELLSGERLSETVYLQKAEENMLNLIQESEVRLNQTNSIGIIVMMVLSILPIAFILFYGRTFYFDGGFSWAIWVDPPTIIPMITVAVLYLIGTKTMRTFLKAFAIVCGKKSYTYTEIRASQIAVKMVSAVWLTMGVLMSALDYLSLAIGGAVDYAGSDRFVLMALNFAVSTLGIVYGLFGYLILTPIKTKLELYMDR